MQFYLALLLLGHILQIKGENMVEKEEKKTMLYTVKSLANQDHESHVATVMSNDTALNDDERGFAIPLMMDPRLIYWAARGVDPHSMFKEKFFDKSFPSLLEDLKFKTWVRYLIYLRKKHPEKPVYAIDILTNKHGVVPLTEMIEKALVGTNSAQKELGKILASEQQYLWRMRNEQDVFTILQLDKAGDDLPKTTGLLTWYNYEMKKYAKDLDVAEFSICYQLAVHYDGDALARMFDGSDLKFDALARMSDGSDLKFDAVKLMMADIKKVIESKRDEIPLIHFLAGHRQTKLVDLLRDENLLIKMNTNSAELDSVAFGMVMKNYGVAASASKLWAAHLVPETSEVAIRLQNVEFHWWGNASPIETFKRLGLGDNINEVLTHPNLVVFNTFMATLVKKGSIPDYSPVDLFIECFGEVPVARMLEDTQKKAKSETAESYQVGLFKKWQTESLEDIKARFGVQPAKIDKKLFQRYEEYLNPKPH
ncbi:uncharacterized protein PHALS_11147 [Plasmopara halstedii]|uniref:RxLR-like protein n=1 Tax=Plasmopara halstedii TaxID=4781 RepID=A0A0P1AIV7_PLAHL|nr:uncharacterized protein PHALS_11147 [Plasmopara halstedii]CEG40974.1 hypothetical protein PHALS_11147 [Plasmopara halstedii]|eukprot:XP_024577343.1 hypothetical protein PHALS_11147 [Plasmopara halstedii]